MKTIEEQAEISQREEFARQQAIWKERHEAWEAGGKVGSPPPHPIPPHKPGGRSAASDLVFVDAMRDGAPDAFDDMKELVRSLPLRVQLRLSKLPPGKFLKEAKRMVARYEAIRAADPEKLMGPNAKRRLARKRQQLSNIADEILARAPVGPDRPIAVRCELCGLQKDPIDHDGHGLGECVAVCETCEGAGTVARQGQASQSDDDDQPCPSCRGLGGIPYPDQPDL